jgi:leucyl/phenylalanyl-tRNA---protein transferase
VSILSLPLLAASPTAPFPDPARALREPDGLLAFGGDLSPERLLTAYRSGIFPWYSDGQPILWWSPDPRMVVNPAALHLSRRYRRQLAHCDWTVRADHAFEAVIDACASIPRHGQDGTWITDDMRGAYVELHRLGHAHSVEVYAGDRLLGGVYGVAIGRAFFGESMFGRVSGASRLALAGLARRLAEWEFDLLDGQVESDHLATLGFAPLPRPDFLARCAAACRRPAPPTHWPTRFGLLHAATFAGDDRLPPVPA